MVDCTWWDHQYMKIERFYVNWIHAKLKKLSVRKKGQIPAWFSD